MLQPQPLGDNEKPLILPILFNLAIRMKAEPEINIIFGLGVWGFSIYSLISL